MNKARHTTTKTTTIRMVSRTIPTDRTVTPTGANPPPSGGATVGGVGASIIPVVSIVTTGLVLGTAGISEGVGVGLTTPLLLVEAGRLLTVVVTGIPRKASSKHNLWAHV